MDYNTAAYRDPLIRYFGSDLENDPNLNLTSEPTYKYNCIAYAMGMDDRWVDTNDVPWHWWPPVPLMNTSPESLIMAFEYFGFEKCDMDDTMDERYDKVVLYRDAMQWLHAARVEGVNLYHSKFGEGCDGTHSAGDVLMSKYGRPYQVMRRLKTNAHLTDELKGQFTGFIKTPFVVRVGFNNENVILYKGNLYSEISGHELVLVGNTFVVTPKIVKRNNIP